MLSQITSLPTSALTLIFTNFVLLVCLFCAVVPPKITRWYRKIVVAKEIEPSDCSLNLEKMRGLSRYLEQLESHLSVFFLLSEDMMCIADDKGFFTKVNPAWTNILGWTSTELVGRPYTDFVHPDDLAETLQCAKDLHDRSIFKFRNRYKVKGGGYKRLSWTASPFTVQGYTYAIARYID